MEGDYVNMDNKVKIIFRIKFRGLLPDDIEIFTQYYIGTFNENYTLFEALQEACLSFGYNFENSEYPVNYVIDSNLFEFEYKLKQLQYENNGNLFDNIKLIDLNKQFNLSNKIIKASCIFGGIGGGVGRFRGIHFYFHTNEKDLHHIPHIHCRYNDIEFRVKLTDLKIIDNVKIRNKKIISTAIKYIKINQSALLRYWDNVIINGQSVKCKMYFPI